MLLKKLFILCLISLACISEIAAQVPIHKLARPKLNPLEWFLLGGPLLRLEPTYNAKLNYRVLLKDGSELMAKSKIYFDTTLKQCYLIYTDKEQPRGQEGRTIKIFPDTTISITRTGNNLPEKVGVAGINCWAFKILDGKIKLYSAVPYEKQEVSAFFVSMQIDNGTPEIWDSAKLYHIVKTVPKALIAWGDEEYFKCISLYNKANKTGAGR